MVSRAYHDSLFMAQVGKFTSMFSNKSGTPPQMLSQVCCRSPCRACPFPLLMPATGAAPPSLPQRCSTLPRPTQPSLPAH